tara:strand:+ start:139 stop:1293 length:1155 start_codon:yes stop_codon:yes gene_type:complete
MQTGTQIGKYTIGRKLGAGGMADVYLASDQIMGREVALKVVPPEISRNEETLNRFYREVRSVASLNHPNVVPIYDVGSDVIDGLNYHFYAMAYMSGGDLKAKILRGLSDGECIAITSQIASALEHAHRRGLVHRDIKPENILFDEDARAMLADLGIAKAIGGSTRMTNTGMSIGTPHYMSPEQAKGEQVDGRSDLYSLGVLLFEMSCGKAPFQSDDSFAIALKHITDPLPLDEIKNDFVRSIVSVLTAKQPHMRLQNTNELLIKLSQWNDTIGKSFKQDSDTARAVPKTIVRDAIIPNDNDDTFSTITKKDSAERDVESSKKKIKRRRGRGNYNLKPTYQGQNIDSVIKKEDKFTVIDLIKTLVLFGGLVCFAVMAFIAAFDGF